MTDATTSPSVFDHKSLSEIHAEIQEAYRADNRPWVIGYSGGKDSTSALQLIWYALSEMPREDLTKPVYVISSDTLVETPVIVDYIDTTLHRINEAAAEQDLPIEAHKVEPQLNETFWVNIIGRGYPAPDNSFRWCTDRMKIKPANRFIMGRIAEFGEAIVVLGVRKGESATRDQVMSLHRFKNSKLSRHSRFPRAYVYTPIEEFTLDDVWSYLLQVKSPWGNNNRDLVALYRNANADECPLVVDSTTPSCGNSRFGCWVCTVVTDDKTMQGMIDNGDDWMEPLLEFRNWLKSTQDPEMKPIYRSFKRRDGNISYKKDGSLIPGPYKFEFRKEILKRLLETQLEVQKHGPDPEFALIHDEEIHEIRRLWRSECQDWEDTVPKIYREVMGQDLDWREDDLGSFSAHERDILHAACEEEDDDVNPQLVMKLLDVERQLQGMNRRSSIYNRIDQTLREEWRSDEVLGELSRLAAEASAESN